MIRVKRFINLFANNPVSLGKFGEMKVSSIFHPAFFGQENQVVLNDVIINDGRDHQIDHIVILPYGIFVIETKNIMGKIKGNLYDDVFSARHSGRTLNFYNPIMQNEKHVEVVKKLLGLEDHVYSVVVFANSNKPQNLPHFVVNLEQLKPYIQTFSNDNVFSLEDIKSIESKFYN